MILWAHGIRDRYHPLQSALLLTPPRNRVGAIDATGDLYRAGRAAEQWTLRAKLVTVAGCWTASGPPAGTDGPLGYPYAVLAAGADSCLATLWAVDDFVTALVVVRTYAHLTAPNRLPKAEALAEAKRWVRDLTEAEIVELEDCLSHRPHQFDAVAGSLKKDPNARRPYADPRYWAAFVLVGLPD